MRRLFSALNRGLFAAVTAALLLAAGAAETRAAEPIKLGTFLAVTGPASFLGEPELQTFQMYIEDINKSGGVLGRPIELIHYDVQHVAKNAQTAVKRLIENDKVDIIVGGSTSGTTMAVVPLVERAGMPFISLAAADVIVKPVKKWVFKMPHTASMACAKIFEDMKKQGMTTIGMISGSGGFDKDMRKQCHQIAPTYGITIAADESYGPKDTDMTAQLTKIKGTSGVQAVLNCGFGQGPAIVTKNFRQLGFSVPLYQSHGVASKKYIELAGKDAVEGVRLPATTLLVADQLPDSDPQKAVALAYKEKFEKVTGNAVSIYGGHAYDGLQVALAAIARAGSTDKAKVRDEIERTAGFIGTAGIYNMTPEDHLGLDLTAFKMLEIRNGDWTIVE